VHTIHEEKCISCGACYDVCPTAGAIRFYPKHAPVPAEAV
jgi:NAD-dependent dihydropyrimidine dehydrogenase PreA subunit